MSTKKVNTVKEEKAVVETLKYRIEFPDGSIAEGSTTSREFAPNVSKGFQNTGFQCKVANGNYSGNLMIIDYSKQKRI